MQLDFEQPAFFKIKVDGISAENVEDLRVESEDKAHDHYDETWIETEDGFTSEKFTALYSSNRIYKAAPDSVVDESQRDVIRDQLGLNMVHNDGANAVLATQVDGQPFDRYSRRIDAEPIFDFTFDKDVVQAGGQFTGMVKLVGNARRGLPRGTLVIRTDDGQETRAPIERGVTDYSFDFAAGKSGVRTVSVAVGISENPADAVIFRTSASVRVLGQGQAWSAEQRQAWEALRVNGAVPGNPVNRNRIISELYAEAYNSNPAAFKWSGMAALASYLVGDAMAEAESWMLKIGDGPAGLPSPRTGFELLAQGNLDVYEDMYPQMIAYSSGGLVALGAMRDRDHITQFQYLAWTNIDQGVRAGHPHLVWNGNHALLRSEQEVTLQRGVYAADPAYWSMLTNATIPAYGLLAEMPSPIPGDPSVFQSFRVNENADGVDDVPDNASIGNFDARWHWIETMQVPAYKLWEGGLVGGIIVNDLLEGVYKSR